MWSGKDRYLYVLFHALIQLYSHFFSRHISLQIRIHLNNETSSLRLPDLNGGIAYKLCVKILCLHSLFILSFFRFTF
uniref:Uncharacterized protein n=1 Tax=uncultured marine virus TaxID=186617 RepID=A0A0F7L4C0_9VIRU|nr:hypothetical protein [uncultured marine virus]